MQNTCPQQPDSNNNLWAQSQKEALQKLDEAIQLSFDMKDPQAFFQGIIYDLYLEKIYAQKLLLERNRQIAQSLNQN